MTKQKPIVLIFNFLLIVWTLAYLKYQILLSLNQQGFTVCDKGMTFYTLDRYITL